MQDLRLVKGHVCKGGNREALTNIYTGATFVCRLCELKKRSLVFPLQFSVSALAQFSLERRTLNEKSGLLAGPGAVERQFKKERFRKWI